MSALKDCLQRFNEKPRVVDEKSLVFCDSSDDYVSEDFCGRCLLGIIWRNLDKEEGGGDR